MQDQTWYDGSSRPGVPGNLPTALAAHIIDGQQRIATVVLTYAILHHLLSQHLGADMSDEHRIYLRGIAARFTWRDEGQDERRLLLRTAGKL